MTNGFFESKLKYLVVEVCPATPHFETSIEIARLLSERGNQVTYFPMFLYLDYLDFLSNRNAVNEIDLRITWLNYAKEKLPQEIRWFTEAEISDGEINALPISLRSKIEQASLSSLTQRLLLPQSLLHLVDHQALYDTIFYTAAKAYIYAKNAIIRSEANVVITFNGRFANASSVWLAAHKADRECYFHERGPDIKKFQLWRRKIHDLRSYYNQIIEHCGPSNLDLERRLVASKWFKKKRLGTTTNWMQFSIASGKKQEKYKEFNVFFSSSMDEFDYVENTFWSIGLGDQIDALKKLIKVHIQCERTLVIRVHPNIKNKHPIERQFWTSLANEFSDGAFIFFENFESECDSYALLDDASVVFHAGSTLAVESIYHGKPTYAITQWLGLYDESTLLVSSEEAIRNLILSESPRNSGIEFALRFGYFQETSGILHEHYVPTGLFQGELTDP